MPTFTLVPSGASADGYWSNSIFNNNASTLLLGATAVEYYNSFFVFSGVPVPQGATVTNATLTLRAQSTTPPYSGGYVWGVLNPNVTVPPSSTPSANALPLTATGAFWTAPFFSLGNDYTSPNFATQATEIFAQSAWASGNAMMIVVRTSGALDNNIRSFSSWESANQPVLSITYTYTAPQGTATNYCPLFIGQYCYDLLKPSGTLSVSSSGNFVTSDSTGSNWHNYINDSAYDGQVDTTYLQMIGSGITSTIPYFMYLKYTASAYEIKKYDTTTSTKTTLISYPITSGITSLCTDYINDNIFYGINSVAGNQLRKYNIRLNNDELLFNTSNLVDNVCVDYTNKKLFFSTINTLYYCDLNGSNLVTYSVISGTDKVVKITDDLFGSKILVAVRKQDPFQEMRVYQIPNAGNVEGCIYQVFSASAPSFNNFDKYENKMVFGISTGSNIYVTDSGTCSITLLSTYANVYNDFRIDRHNHRLYHTNSSGTDIGYYNMDTGAETLLGINDGTILKFDFPRELLKRSIELDLTDVTNTFNNGIGNPLVSDANFRIKGSGLNLSFISPRVEVKNLATGSGILYSTSDYCVWTTSDGLSTKTEGPSTVTVNSSQNYKSAFNTSKLILDIYTIYSSGGPFNFRTYATEVNLSCSGTYSSALVPSGFTTLYISGAEASSGVRTNNCTLYIHGLSTSSGNIPLYICSATTKASGMSLYASGQGFTGYPPTGAMNLFLKAKTPVPVSGNIPLFIWSTSRSGLYKTTTLYLAADPASGQKPGSMNVFVAGFGSRTQTSNMNLYLHSPAPRSEKGTTLFIANNYTAIGSGMPLSMRGPVGSSGYVPFSGSMNLYISRRSEAIDRGTSLYIKGPLSITSGVPFSVTGGYNSAGSGVRLAISGGDSKNNTAKLFVSGF